MLKLGASAQLAFITGGDSMAEVIGLEEKKRKRRKRIDHHKERLSIQPISTYS